MSVYLIKQIPDEYAEQTGLAKYNRSRMPGCKDIFQAAYNEVSGKFITGLSNEEASELSNNNVNYSEDSKFWETYNVTIHSDNPKVFDTNVNEDKIAFKMLIANGYIAPDKDSVGEPRYRDAKYYAYTEEQESTETVTRDKRKDLATKLLLDISDNKDKMVLYGQYLEGVKYSSKFNEDTLYTMLRTYINKSHENAGNFIMATNKGVEEIQQKIIIDKALKNKVIQRVSLGKKKQAYQFGQVHLGSTLEELYTNLSKSDFAPELIGIKNEVENR